MEKLKNLKKSILSSYFIERKLQICSVFMKFMKSELITIRRQAGNLKNSKNIFSLHRENCRLRKVIKESLKKFEESCTFSNFIILKSWLLDGITSNENDKFKLSPLRIFEKLEKLVSVL